MGLQARAVLSNVFVLSILGAWACSEIPAHNPYDPATPLAQQQSASLEGSVALPEGFDSSLFDGFSVSLRIGSEASEAIRTAALDNGGRFDFSNVPPGGYVLVVDAPGFVAPPIAVAITIGATLDVGAIGLSVPVAPEAFGTLSGVARRSGSTRHEGILVEAMGTGFLTVTDESGAFEMTLPAARYTLRVSFAGYTTSRTEALELEAEGRLELDAPVLLDAEPGAISGVLAPAPGSPTQPALDAPIVRLFSAGDAMGEDAIEQISPSDDGAFVIGGVAPGAYDITASLDGFFDARRRVVVDAGQRVDLGRVELVSRPTDAELTGIARRSGADDHAGITVEVAGARIASQTDSDGAYAVRVPARARGYTLRFTLPGHTRAQLETGAVEADSSTVLEDVLLVGAPGRVFGRVVLDRPDGTPLNSVNVLRSVNVALVVPGDDGPPRTEVPDRDGGFAFEDVPAGHYELDATVEGFLPASRGVSVEVGATVNAGPLRLVAAIGGVRGAEITGRVQLDCGAEACDHGGIRVETLAPSFVTHTGADGRFRLSVVAGNYTLRFSAPGYLEATYPGVDVDEGETRALAQDPAAVLGFAPGQISGTIWRLESDGSTLVPAFGAVVGADADGDAEGAGPARSVNAVADDDGHFRLVGLRPGPWSVTVALAGHVGSTLARMVVAGGTTDLGRVVLDRPRGRLRGRVIGAGADGVRELPSTTVIIRGVAGDPATGDVVRVAFVGADLDWSVDGLPRGTYTVRASSPGFRDSGRLEIALDGSEVEVPQIALVPRHHVLVGASVSGAHATLELDADADLAFVRLWLDDAEPPLLRPRAGALEVELPREGPHLVRVQLATVDAGHESEGEIAYLSPILTALVVRDDTAPTLELFDLPAYAAERSIEFEVRCHDALAPDDALWLDLSVDGVESHRGPWQPRVRIALPGEDGPKSIVATCTDWRGHFAEATASVALDLTPPVVESVRLGSGDANTPVADLTLSVQFTARDDGGIDGVAISEHAALDCANAAYRYAAEGPVTFTLSPGDGPRSVYVCARDRAGLVSARAASNAVTLDTEAPDAGRIELAAGATLVDGADVALALSSDSGWTAVVLTGDLADGGGDEIDRAQVPPRIALSDGDGPKTVTAVLLDAAGNASPPFGAHVVVDSAAPRLGRVEINGAAPYAIERDVELAIDCADALAPAEALTVEVTVDDAPVYAGAWEARIPFSLAGDEGTKTVEVGCTDWIGHRTEAAVSIALDLTPPRLFDVVLGPGGANTPVADRSLRIAYASDDSSGVAGVAISDDPALDCATAAYVFPASGAVTFTLSDGDGPRSVYLCARDAAGRVSAPVPSPAVVLDTVAPAAGRLVLPPASKTRNVAIEIEADAPWAAVEISGDVTAATRHDAEPWPDTVELTNGDGPKSISIVLFDAAGNASRAFGAAVVLDRVAPRPGLVSLGDDQAVVHSRTLPVSIAGTAPDRVRIWEPEGGVCVPAGCNAGGFEPFSPSLSFTLSPSIGHKTVCWTFCDAAGNATEGGGGVELGVYVARPRPVLDRLGDITWPAFIDGSLVIEGEGIAPDTIAVIDDFIAPCRSAAGACSTVDPQHCARTCAVDLPAEVVRNIGVYAVRLHTPDPVAGGLGTSAKAAFLSVLAPTPFIYDVSPGGVRYFDAAFSARTTFQVEVTGTGFADNITFRLGPRTGEVTSIEDIELVGAVPGSPGRRATVIFDFAGLLPDSVRPFSLAAVNPTPGGGETEVPFAWQLSPALCDFDEGCAAVVAPYTAHTRDGTSRGLGLFVDDVVRTPLAWTPRGELRVVDAPTRRPLATHRPWQNGGLIPMPMTTRTFPEITAGISAGIRVDLAPASRRGDGVYETEVLHTLPDFATSIATGDLNEDGRPDIVVVIGYTDTIEVLISQPDGNYLDRRESLGVEFTNQIAIADYDGDGHQDVILGASTALRILLGLGDGEFDGLRGFTGGAKRFALADVDDDGLVDIAVTDGDGFRVRGRKRATYTAFDKAVVDFDERSTTSDITADDLDGDGRVDFLVVDRSPGRLLAYMRDRDGVWQRTFEHAVDAWVTGVRTGDFDGDGVPDAAIVTRDPHSIQTFRGLGDGTFDESGHFGIVAEDMVTQPRAIEIADLDGDSRLDILHFGSARPGTGIFSGRGDGSFTPVETPIHTINAAGAGLAIADLEADGAPEVLIAGETVLNLWRSGPGTSLGRAVYTETGATARGFVLADLDGEAPLDAIEIRSLSIQAWRGRPSGGFVPLGDELSTGSLGGFEVRDITDDGRPDVIFAALAYEGEAAVSISAGGAGGAWGEPEVYPFDIDVSELAVGDIDGDDDLDIVVVDRDTGSLAIRRTNAAGNIAAQEVHLGVVPSARDVATADLDGDGADEIIVTNESQRDTFVVFVTEVGIEVTVYEAPDRTGPMAFGDLDGDGALDIVMYNGTNAVLHYAYGDGNGAFGVFRHVPTAGSQHTSIGQRGFDLGDLNGDGRLDIALVHTDDQGLDIYTGQPDRAPFVRWTTPLPDSQSAIAIGDHNGDGALDIVTSTNAPFTNRFETWLRPSPQAWTRTLDPVPPEGTAVRPNDTTLVYARQATAFVHELGVRVRLRSAEDGILRNVLLSLASPRGNVHSLGRGPVDGTVWQLAETAEAFDCHVGWQPDGVWTLIVDHSGAAAVTLEDFALTTRDSDIWLEPAPRIPLACNFGARRHGCALTRPFFEYARPRGNDEWTLEDFTDGRGDDFIPSCVDEPPPNDDLIYLFEAPRAGRWRIDSTGSDFDVVLTALETDDFDRDCRAAEATERVCHNDVNRSNTTALIEVDLTLGERIYIVADGASADAAGALQLNARRVSDLD